MARSEARLCVDIWSDEDFLACSADAQRMFMFLISQPDLAHDGVIALRERRWAGAARGLTPPMVEAALSELQDRRFVVIDDRTEELLIRSFIRRDKVYKQPNVLRAAHDHLPLIASQSIRRALAAELTRVASEQMPDASLLLVKAMLEALPNPSWNPSLNPSGKADRDQQPIDRNPTPGTPGERGVVTVVTNSFPVPRDPESPSPDPLPLASLAGAVAPPPETTDGLIAEWISHCRKRPPGNVIGQVGKQIKAMLAEGIDPADVRAGLATWHQKGLSPAALPSVVNELMNAAPARASPNGRRASTTDSRVDAAMDLASQLERLEIGS